MYGNTSNPSNNFNREFITHLLVNLALYETKVWWCLFSICWYDLYLTKWKKARLNVSLWTCLRVQFVKVVSLIANFDIILTLRVQSERYIAVTLHRKSSLMKENRKLRREIMIPWWAKRIPRVKFALNLQFSVVNQLQGKKEKGKGEKEGSTRNTCFFLFKRISLREEEKN